MFQSVAASDKDTRQAMSKTELATAMSQLSIGDDKYDTKSPAALYTVDFEGCMKSFLSRRAPVCFGLDTRESINNVVKTLERFMDYLLHHDVCPEYKVPVLAARDLCREADSELWAIAEASRWLPGDFNIACSTLFGGEYGTNYDGTTNWSPGQQGEPTFVGLTPQVAEQIMKFGVAGAATEDIYQAFQERDQAENFEDRVQLAETRRNTGFEIFSIVPPTKECIHLYNTQCQDFRPVGRVYARPWKNPDAAPEDLTNEEKESLTRKTQSVDDEEYVFFVESVILNNLYIGFKIEATVHKLNCGIWFFDNFVNVYASFDTWILNDMMYDWKKPRWLAGSVEFEKQQEFERLREFETGLDSRGHVEIGEELAEDASQGLKEPAKGEAGANTEGIEGADPY